jgi:hypothetical protein
MRLRSMLVIALLTATSCGGVAATSTTIEDDGRVPSTTKVQSSAPDSIIAAIIEDASERLALEPGDVEVSSADKVIWNDGSLGCPEEGVLYTQTLIEGYRVVITGPERDLDYRVHSSGDFRVCENSEMSTSLPEDLQQGDVDLVVQMARQMLGEMTGEAPESFLLVSSEFTSVPSREPCSPPQADERDPESPLVPAIEVVLADGEVEHRLVASDGVLQICGASPGSKLLPGSSATP